MQEFKRKFIQNFIEDHRYRYLLDGLKTTLIIAICSVLLGILIGFVIAVIRSSYDKSDKKRKNFGYYVLKVLNIFARIYLTVIRGTPVLVQLLIYFYCIFTAPDTSKVFVAVMAFGINSGAYVAEIVRSGIMSIDNGQFEAGRSLGFSYAQTMIYIIIPQAVKNVLPALSNEFIVLLKETSVAGYIGIQDITKAGDFIRSRTFEALFPLIAVAIIYLIIVMILTWLVSKLERRLRNSDH